MNADQLLENFERIAEAPDSVSHLRKFILDLAVRGKLVEQDSNDESALQLIEQIRQSASEPSRNRRSLSKLTSRESAPPFTVPAK